MEDLDIAAVPTKANSSELLAIQEDIKRSLEFYGEGDFVEALLFLTDAAETIARLDDTPTWLIRDTQYFMYKAYVMSSADKSRRIRLPINFLHLESIIAQDKNTRRRRVVWAVTHFGRFGLRVHDFFEQRGI